LEYIRRVNKKHLSVIQFIQTVASLVPTTRRMPDDLTTEAAAEFDNIKKALLGRYFALIGIVTRFGISAIVPTPRGQNLLYNIGYMMAIIPMFIVTQLRDVKLDSQVGVLAAMCSFVPGPAVAMAAPHGYGLLARQNYDVGDLITSYGGMISNQDINESLQRGEELRRLGNRYALSLEDESGGPDPTPGEEWIVDSRLFFTLSDKGRWLNTIRSEGEDPNNATFDIWSPLKDHHPAHRQVAIRARRPILAGDWITVDYGPNYPQEFLDGDDVFDVLPGIPVPWDDEDGSKRRKLVLECEICSVLMGLKVGDTAAARQCVDCGDVFCTPKHGAKHTASLCIMWDRDVAELVAKRTKKDKRHPSRSTARKILKDGSIRGKKLTARQRRYFGWLLGDRPV